MDKNQRKAIDRSLLKLRRGRLAAIQAIYALLHKSATADQVIRDVRGGHFGLMDDDDVTAKNTDVKLAAKLIILVCERLDYLEDVMVKYSSDKRDIRNSEALIKAILITGFAELLARPNVDKGVITSEYVAITDGFYDQAEQGLVNAIMDRAASSIREELIEAKGDML